MTGLDLDTDADDVLPMAAPSTWKVVALFVVAAALMSYLGAYAFVGALAANGIVHFTPGSDPRLRWMLYGFVLILSGFTLAAAVVQRASSRHLKSIAASEDVDD